MIEAHSGNTLLRLIVCGFAISITALALAQGSDGLVIEQASDRDIYAANREVAVNSTIDGDLVAAGMQIDVDGDVSGDVIAAARNIEIRSQVGDDVRVAGQNITISSPVRGHVVAAGQNVTVEQPVGDWAWLAGYSVEVRGNVGGTLRVRASNITIDSEVAGDIELVGDQLTVGPNTVVRGDLRWRSRNAADISPDAQIDGELVEEPLPGVVEELAAGGKYSLPLNLIAAVVVLFLLFSRPLRSSAQRIATNPVWSLLLGVAVLLLCPILAVLLFITGIGAWLGFAVIFIYLVILLLGILTGLFAASDIVLRRYREQPVLWQSLAAIFVTVVAVGLLAKVPWLGSLAVVAIWLIGIGALCWNSWATLKSLGHNGVQPS